MTKRKGKNKVLEPNKKGYSDWYQEIVKKRHASLPLYFNLFAKKISDKVGSPVTFIIAIIFVIIWALTGHYFHYSDTWQLIINTSTTIITFLVVFIIQNTQNRDTEILNLKIDELIKSKKGARNEIINLHHLSDAELKELEEKFEQFKNKKTGK